MNESTDRLFAESLRWVGTPTDELWMLADTQPIPTARDDIDAKKTHAAADVADWPNTDEDITTSSKRPKWTPPLSYEGLVRLLDAMKRTWNM